MNLRELINRLEKLSNNGRNDDLPVILPIGKDWQDYPEICFASIKQDPDYNFDEANCGPDEWVELNTTRDEREFFNLDER